MTVGQLSEVLADALSAVASSRDDLERFGDDPVLVAKAVWFFAIIEQGCLELECAIADRLEERYGMEVALPGRYDPAGAPDLEALLDGYVEHLEERLAIFQELADELRAQALAEGPDRSDLEELARELEGIVRDAGADR